MKKVKLAKKFKVLIKFLYYYKSIAFVISIFAVQVRFLQQ
jgi:hypothetical protein